MNQPEQVDIPPLQQLFDEAKTNGGMQYLYTLVRIDGIQCYEGYQDEFVALRNWLRNPGVSDLPTAYRYLASSPAGPLALLQNLLNCANGKDYHIRPFSHLKTGQFPNYVWPSIPQKVESLVESARASGFTALAGQIEESYPPQFLGDDSFTEDQVRVAYEHLSRFLKELVECYFDKLMRFKKEPKYRPLPGSLDVLELIIDEEFGLSGLRIHFPNNCTAEFVRNSKGVLGNNFEFGPPVTSLIMSMEPSTNEYRVNGKRLYELGLPGRYNRLGEWKPLIYPGNAEHLMKECMQLSDDPDVQGVLLYMRLTGYRCIEFVLRTNIELPGSYTSTEERNLHIWKCPTEEKGVSDSNVRVYDCWFDLQSGSVEEIASGLAGIGYFVNVLCFSFGAAYSWRNKYRMTSLEPGWLLTPGHDDLKIVSGMLEEFMGTEEAAILVAGIDWYNRGSTSTNIFNRFLCYYIALESVAVAIADGSGLVKIRLAQRSKAAKKALATACIQAKHQQLFATDPIRFVQESYFDCVQSLTSKTKAAVEAIFGQGHPYLEALFTKSADGDMALKDLRGDLAHGDVTLMDKQHEHLIRKHVYEIERITREFLLRVLFRVEPSEQVPSWSRKCQQPLRLMWSTTDKIFPKDADWKIRAEWCE